MTDPLSAFVVKRPDETLPFQPPQYLSKPDSDGIRRWTRAITDGTERFCDLIEAQRLADAWGGEIWGVDTKAGDYVDLTDFGKSPQEGLGL